MSNKSSLQSTTAEGNLLQQPINNEDTFSLSTLSRPCRRGWRGGHCDAWCHGAHPTLEWRLLMLKRPSTRPSKNRTLRRTSRHEAKYTNEATQKSNMERERERQRKLASGTDESQGMSQAHSVRVRFSKTGKVRQGKAQQGDVRLRLRPKQ